MGMTPLFTPTEFTDALSRELLPLQCECCGGQFLLAKNEVQLARRKGGRRGSFCSYVCAQTATKRRVERTCKNCGKVVELCPSDLRRHQKRGYKHIFCSSRCTGIYSNAHKTKGSNRSKLECWLEDRLTTRYPELNIKYNSSEAISAELDIYVPSLRLAFELNGIFHYEPIFGAVKLATTQSNDRRKYQACLERGIELCIIDTSSFRYFKARGAERFLAIVSELIDRKLEARAELASA